jgi:cytochrome oxidase assembly protein ShyY1
MPNNHLLYAIQWFFFALARGLIYVLALERRQKQKHPGEGPGVAPPPPRA